MMEVKETIHPTNISHQHPNPMTSIFLLWLILLLLEFRILPQLRKTPCTLGIYQWKLGVRFRTTNQNISFVSSEIFASFLSWIHFWWFFFFSPVVRMPWLLWGDHSFKYFSLFETPLTSMFSTAVFDNQKIIPSALFLLFSLRIS